MVELFLPALLMVMLPVDPIRVIFARLISVCDATPAGPPTVVIRTVAHHAIFTALLTSNVMTCQVITPQCILQATSFDPHFLVSLICRVRDLAIVLCGQMVARHGKVSYETQGFG